ncbi:hypothetical protein BB561_006993, partial [Smittium simulii]
VIDHVNKTFTLDERTIQSVSDPSAIYQFLNLHDLMFSTNSQSKLKSATDYQLSLTLIFLYIASKLQP